MCFRGPDHCDAQLVPIQAHLYPLPAPLQARHHPRRCRHATEEGGTRAADDDDYDDDDDDDYDDDDAACQRITQTVASRACFPKLPRHWDRGLRCWVSKWNPTHVHIVNIFRSMFAFSTNVHSLEENQNVQAGLTRLKLKNRTRARAMFTENIQEQRPLLHYNRAHN